MWDAQFVENKISESITGYQLKVRVANKGNKICFNVTAQFNIKNKERKPISLMLVHVDNNKGRISTTTSESEGLFSEMKYAWFNDKDKQTNVLQLKQNDNYYIMFPYERRWWCNSIWRW